MSYSDLLIVDSQTMCAEAGLLGVPFIRINDFVGKLKYLDDLEQNYNLGWGVKPSDSKRVISLIDQVLTIDNVKDKWIEKREKVFNDKEDLVEISLNLIETFSKS